MGGGEKKIIHLSLHCHHQNDSCNKMCSDESYFNVTVGERSFFWDEARFERTTVPLRSRKLSYRTV